MKSGVHPYGLATRQNFFDRPPFRLPVVPGTILQRQIPHHIRVEQLRISWEKKTKCGTSVRNIRFAMFHFSVCHPNTRCDTPRSRKTVRIPAKHWTWLRTCRAGRTTYFCFSIRLRLFLRIYSVCSITDFCCEIKLFFVLLFVTHIFSPAFIATAADSLDSPTCRLAAFTQYFPP